MLRLYHPKCIKIIEISNELSGKNVKQLSKDKKMEIRQLHKMNSNLVHSDKSAIAGQNIVQQV